MLNTNYDAERTVPVPGTASAAPALPVALDAEVFRFRMSPDRRALGFASPIGQRKSRSDSEEAVCRLGSATQPTPSPQPSPQWERERSPLTIRQK